MYFLVVAAGPIVCFALAALWSKRFRVPYLLACAAALLIIGAVVGIMFEAGPEGASIDTEIWNGRITSRFSERVSCSHSYSCNCREECSTNSQGHESCSTVCDTCYEHSYDVDWRAVTTNQENIYFSRVDRQGLTMPPRYATAFVKEPTAIEHHFQNYFKLATHNVVANFEPGVLNVQVPAYPMGYDLYRVDKLVDPDAVLASSRKDWVWLLNELNADLGAAKQVNVILYVTKQPDPKYLFNIQKEWLGGKKNDVVVVVGAPSGDRIEWSGVVTWSTDATIKTVLRDDLTTIGSLGQRDAVIAAIRKDVTEHFQRVHMKDQKYLREAWEPSNGVTVGLIILFTVLSLIALFVIPNAIDSYGMEENESNW